jgi:hypothetical protein
MVSNFNNLMSSPIDHLNLCMRYGDFSFNVLHCPAQHSDSKAENQQLSHLLRVHMQETGHTDGEPSEYLRIQL